MFHKNQLLIIGVPRNGSNMRVCAHSTRQNNEKHAEFGVHLVRNVFVLVCDLFISTVSRSTYHLTFAFYFSNLDETTRSVYKENVRVTAALEYHMVESKDLKKVNRTSLTLYI